MKTKNLILSLLAVFAIALMSSCDKKEKEDFPNGFEQRLDHVFDAVLVPEEFSIVLNSNQMFGSQANTSRTRLFLHFAGKSYVAYRESGVVPRPVSDFCERIGDIAHPKRYRSVQPGGLYALNQGILSVAVEAVEAYNAEYPSGSSLNPIVELSYISFDLGFKELLSKGGGIEDAGVMYRHLLSDGIAECKIPSAEDMMLAFTEAPSQPRVKLRFVVTFDNGTSLERTEELEIHEAN